MVRMAVMVAMPGTSSCRRTEESSGAWAMTTMVADVTSVSPGGSGNSIATTGGEKRPQGKWKQKWDAGRNLPCYA